MQSTHHEFEIFEDIINGELEPIKLFGEKLDLAINYLKEQQDKCHVTTFVRVNNTKKKTSYDRLIVPDLHPLACEYINQQTLITSNSFGDQRITQILQELSSGSSADQTIIIDQKNNHLIGVSKKTRWADLDPYLIKFCYYHQMLKDYVKSLKRNLFNECYTLEDETVKRLVNRTHTKLINFCDQVIEKYELTTSDLKLKVKTNYTDKDCMAIVYLHLNDLINCLVNDYYYFLHSEAHVPYNAEILRRYQLQETARKTTRKLSKVPINENLKRILLQTINKVLNLDTQNRITYYEINYYAYLINELHRFISIPNKEVDDNDLIIRLIELGFNHYEFIKHVTQSLESEAEQMSTQLYYEYLIEKRKEWDQCIRCEKKIFSKDLEPAHVSLMNWLKSEIDFYHNKLQQDHLSDHKEKLEVDLSVSQLALMTRLFHEVAMSPKTSISETASYVVENYKTQNSTSISLKSFKNNLYKLEDNTINEVKTKLIAMVNRANEL